MIKNKTLEILNYFKNIFNNIKNSLKTFYVSR